MKILTEEIEGTLNSIAEGQRGVKHEACFFSWWCSVARRYEDSSTLKSAWVRGPELGASSASAGSGVLCSGRDLRSAQLIPAGEREEEGGGMGQAWAHRTYIPKSRTVR